MTAASVRAPTRPLTVRTVEVDDPGDLLPRLPDPGGTAWLRHGEGMVGWGEAARVEAGTGGDRFARAGAALDALLGRAEVVDDVGIAGTGPIAFGSFTFDARSRRSVLIIPRVVLGRRDGRAWLTVVGDEPPDGWRADAVEALPRPGRIRYAGASIPELRWIEAVAATVRELRRGEGALEKVVLARDVLVWAEAPLDLRALAHRLAERFPSCYTFLCDGLVGATPELLVRRAGPLVESVVLAGSAARGADDAEDARLGGALLRSEKDLAEHRPAVASVSDVLAPRCAALAVDAAPSLLRLDNVQHLATAVTGTLAQPASALDLAAALHPTAAVCGTPRGAALERIRALEGMDRARYSGPVGWVDARGDGEWGIALRCAEVDGRRARLFAGAGIVAGSLPEAELEETRLKLRAMQSALES